jgi:GT2 family glycosyltransferase
MLFTVVIPTYKRHEALRDCLICLAHYFNPEAQDRLGFQVEVIVSDDGCEDVLKSLLMRHYPWSLYVAGPKRGPAANRNHGAQQASGDWLVFTDDDCLPQTGWLEAYAASADECDVMEGRTSAVGQRKRVDEECPINETGGFLWSCNFVIRRDLFLQMGGFNEDFPAAAMEDVELNTRVKQAGLRRLFVTNAVVLHPWRLRKGRSYVRVHALSVAKFVSLHPQAADRFSVVSQFKKVLRSFKHNIQYAIAEGRYAGLFRQIFLDCYSNILAWLAVRQIRQP